MGLGRLKYWLLCRWLGHWFTFARVDVHWESGAGAPEECSVGLRCSRCDGWVFMQVELHHQDRLGRAVNRAMGWSG